MNNQDDPDADMQPDIARQLARLEELVAKQDERYDRLVDNVTRLAEAYNKTLRYMKAEQPSSEDRKIATAQRHRAFERLSNLFRAKSGGPIAPSLDPFITILDVLASSTEYFMERDTKFSQQGNNTLRKLDELTEHVATLTVRMVHMQAEVRGVPLPGVDEIFPDDPKAQEIVNGVTLRMREKFVPKPPLRVVKDDDPKSTQDDKPIKH